MRRRSGSGVRAVAVFVLAVVLVAPAVVADEQLPGTGPPHARIGPPIGGAAAEEPPSLAELFWIWLQARIGPPIGSPEG